MDALSQGREDSQADEHDRGHKGAHATQIIDPLADAHAANVQDNRQPQQGEAHKKEEQPVLGQRGGVFSACESPNAGQIEQKRGDEEHVREPVAPAAHEAVKIPEHLLGPKVKAAFPGEAMRQFDDRNALRPEEESERQQPEPDGGEPARRHHRDQIHVGDGHHAQPGEIPGSQDPPQMRSGLMDGGLGSVGGH